MNIEQALSIAIAVSALTAAIIFAVKTPKKNWFKPTVQSNDTPKEWAPVYNWKEKLKLLSLNFCWMIPVLVASRYMPKLGSDLSFYCSQTLEISHLNWYLTGLLITTVLIFIAMAGYAGFYWKKVFQHAQYPLPEQKVWTPQQIITGNKAKRRAKLIMIVLGVLSLLFIVCIIMLGGLITGFDMPKAMAAKC